MGVLWGLTTPALQEPQPGSLPLLAEDWRQSLRSTWDPWQHPQWIIWNALSFTHCQLWVHSLCPATWPIPQAVIKLSKKKPDLLASLQLRYSEVLDAQMHPFRRSLVCRKQKLMWTALALCKQPRFETHLKKILKNIFKSSTAMSSDLWDIPLSGSSLLTGNIC